jgi:hypothetical protein
MSQINSSQIQTPTNPQAPAEILKKGTLEAKGNKITIKFDVQSKETTKMNNDNVQISDKKLSARNAKEITSEDFNSVEKQLKDTFNGLSKNITSDNDSITIAFNKEDTKTDINITINLLRSGFSIEDLKKAGMSRNEFAKALNENFKVTLQAAKQDPSQKNIKNLLDALHINYDTEKSAGVQVLQLLGMKNSDICNAFSWSEIFNAHGKNQKKYQEKVFEDVEKYIKSGHTLSDSDIKAITGIESFDEATKIINQLQEKSEQLEHTADKLQAMVINEGYDLFLESTSSSEGKMQTKFNKQLDKLIEDAKSQLSFGRKIIIFFKNLLNSNNSQNNADNTNNTSKIQDELKKITNLKDKLELLILNLEDMKRKNNTYNDLNKNYNKMDHLSKQTLSNIKLNFNDINTKLKNDFNTINNHNTNTPQEQIQDATTNIFKYMLTTLNIGGSLSYSYNIDTIAKTLAECVNPEAFKKLVKDCNISVLRNRLLRDPNFSQNIITYNQNRDYNQKDKKSAFKSYLSDASGQGCFLEGIFKQDIYNQSI